ncbi:MAG: aminoacyl-tRNA hydrolase [Phycisphaerales bacterium]
MHMIVGLGNPGPEYAKTRHNAGFMVLDRLATRHGITGVKSRFSAGVLDGQVAGHRCLLAQPMTFMNLSGTTVSEAVNFYKLELKDIMVVVDEVALPLGSIRMRASGSAGGHNGLKDIEEKLGTQDYPRLRIGVESPTRASRKDFVLGRFTEEQMADLNPALERACDAIESWLKHGIGKTMSLFNAEG